jgi:hypothetical protein
VTPPRQAAPRAVSTPRLPRGARLRACGHGGTTTSRSDGMRL